MTQPLRTKSWQDTNADKVAAIKATCAAGNGIIKTTKACGVGVSVVQRLEA